MFGTIEVTPRPLRLAYLVDPYSQSQVRDAIRLSSSLWGGTYFPILPLYATMPDNWSDVPLPPPPAEKVIRGYLDAFDPDVLVTFSTSATPQYIADGRRQVVSGAEIWNVIDSPRPLVPKFGIGIFEIFGAIFDECFKYKAKYPIRVILADLPDELSLFWASVFGELPPELIRIVDERFQEPLEIERMAFAPEKLAELLAPRVVFPRRVTEWGLDHESRGGLRDRARLFFFDATKPQDIVDFWNLRALGGAVLGVPKQLQSDPTLRDIALRFLRANRRPWPHNPAVFDFASIIRSRNCTMEEMQAFATSLSINPDPVAGPHDSYYGLQHWYPRIWDEWARYKDGAIPDDIYASDKREYEVNELTSTPARIKTVLPKFAHDYGYHDAPRCANDINFSLYGSDAYTADILPEPAGEQVIQAVGGMASLPGQWRIGRGALVRLVGHESSESVRIPVAEDVMFAWLSDLGWTPTLSTPGILAKRVFRQLEGQLFVLRNERFLGLLEHMNGGKVQRDGSPVAENAIRPDLERDLPIGYVKECVGGSYDNLVSKGVFRLGNKLQCPDCLRRSWFTVTALGDSFTCPKCLATFPAIGSLTEGKWTFKTSGPFSVADYAEGAYAVLLAVEFFARRGMHSLRTTPVLSFKGAAPQKEAIEADFALLWQETLYGEKTDGIIVGECKTYGEFKDKDLARMRYLAKTFPGAILVFSTLRKSLNATEIAEIAAIAKAGREHWKADRPINPVLILTGTELLNFQPPPYCWTGDLRQKFDRIHGLLEICNASQQIYLGLPSWQSDWHEQWERKRAEAARKREQQSTPEGATDTQQM